MIRTFDFIFLLRRYEEEKQRLYHLMECRQDEKYEIGGWTLSFDYNNKAVLIHDNGKDPSLKYKFIPAKITYESLVTLIEMDDPDCHLDITYL